MNWLCVFQEGRCSCTPHGLILSTRSKIRKTIRILQYTIRATGANTITYETDKPCTLQVTPNQIELEVISSLDQCSPVKNPSTALSWGNVMERTHLRRHETTSSWTTDPFQSERRTHRGHAGSVCAAGETYVKWTAGGLRIHLAVVIRRQ